MSATPSDESATNHNQLKLEIRRVAHDISNPLGIIRMAIYFLETGNADDEKRTQYYSMINQNIDRIEALIRELRVLGGSPSVQGTPPETIG